MKKYIFFTFCKLQDMGGMELYYAGKAKCLEEQGWKVYIFHIGKKGDNCAIKTLNKYVKAGSIIYPFFIWENGFIKRELFYILIKKRIKFRPTDNIIIESSDYVFSPWCEFFAARFKAKHIVVPLHEDGDFGYLKYQNKIDFYKFKLKRKELPFWEGRAKRLFNDLSLVEQNETRMFRIDEDPVQDVGCSLIDTVTHDDWNIGYIGRANKGYVPNIIDGVCEFAQNHPDHNIQFVIIGDFTCRKEYYEEKSKGIKNLKLVELGDQFPLPRSYFGKVDVVIAGSGSARCSVYEGKLTLVADASNFLCNGLLGYETKNSIYKDANTVQRSFSEGLERALVKKVYKNLKYDFPPKPGVEECVKQNFEFIASSEQSKEYYSEKELCKGKKKIRPKAFIRLFLECYFPNLFAKIMKWKRKEK